MNMIILNGSPKKNINESNTEIFINEFIKEMTEKPHVKYINRENHIELAKSLKEYDTILMFLPLYIHGMPGSMMKFIEKLDKEYLKGKNLGFFIQAGFPETAQEQFIERYFAELAKLMECNYLGTVSRGQSAAVYMFPKQFKKLYKQLNKLGKKFEETNNFDKNLVDKISYPYNLSDLSLATRGLMKVSYKLGLADMGWDMMLKKNNAFHNRFDKPFS